MLGKVTQKWGKGESPEVMKQGDEKYRLFEKEHIMPNNGPFPEPTEDAIEDDAPLSYWNRPPTKFDREGDYDDLKNHLGNLVMSKQIHNIQYSNHPYLREAPGDRKDFKKNLYESSVGEWCQVKSVALNYDQWNRYTIIDRQKRMARWAIKRWKLECCDDTLDDQLPNLPYLDEHSDLFKRSRQAMNGASKAAKEVENKRKIVEEAASKKKEASEGKETEKENEVKAAEDAFREAEEKSKEAEEKAKEFIPEKEHKQGEKAFHKPIEGDEDRFQPEIDENTEGYDFPEDYYSDDCEIENIEVEDIKELEE
jgi:hypothetical protein